MGRKWGIDGAGYATAIQMHMGHYDNTYNDFTHNDIIYNNKCDYTYNWLTLSTTILISVNVMTLLIRVNSDDITYMRK